MGGCLAWNLDQRYTQINDGVLILLFFCAKDGPSQRRKQASQRSIDWSTDGRWSLATHAAGN